MNRPSFSLFKRNQQSHFLSKLSSDFYDLENLLDQIFHVTGWKAIITKKYYEITLIILLRKTIFSYREINS